VAIAIVQHTSLDAGTVTSANLAFGSNNAGGNFIVVCVRIGLTGQTITVSDTQGNTYSSALQFDDTGGGNTGAIFYALNIKAGANTVTVSYTPGTATLRFSIAEYSGVATTAALDVSSSNQAVSGTALDSGSVTTTADGELLVGMMINSSGDAWTAGTGYTSEEEVPTGASSKLMFEDRIQASAGAVSASATISPSDAWAAGIATFKPPVAGQVFFSLPDDGEQFRSPDLTPRLGGLALDDWLPRVPQPPLFEWDESQRWQICRDVRASWTTGEEDTGLRLIIPNIVYDIDYSRCFDTRSQQEHDPWHTFFLIPVPPPNLGWDDWDWSRDYSTPYVRPPEAEPFDFARPIVTPLAYDESAAFFLGSSGSLAAMVVLDEFVNAPAGSIPFGPAPTGRSVRFGFSISAFR
jgi:hypothetical protein